CVGGAPPARAPAGTTAAVALRLDHTRDAHDLDLPLLQLGEERTPGSRRSASSPGRGEQGLCRARPEVSKCARILASGATRLSDERPAPAPGLHFRCAF